MSVCDVTSRRAAIAEGTGPPGAGTPARRLYYSLVGCRLVGIVQVKLLNQTVRDAIDLMRHIFDVGLLQKLSKTAVKNIDSFEGGG